MRPNTSALHELVRIFKGRDVRVVVVPQGSLHALYMTETELSISGTLVPAELLLVHEFRDHYSLQAGQVMSVEGPFVLYEDIQNR